MKATERHKLKENDFAKSVEKAKDFNSGPLVGARGEERHFPRPDRAARKTAALSRGIKRPDLDMWGHAFNTLPNER